MKLRKDKGLYNKRYYQLIGIVIVLMTILAVRLFVVTVFQHEQWSTEANDQSTKSIYTSAPRGNIYDRNGQVLATNTQVFTASFNSSALTTEEINASCLTLINLLIANGDEYTDDFPIQIDGSGNFYYTYNQEISDWLADQGFEDGLTASQAFKRLRSKYGIDSSLDRYEAMEELETTHNLDVPITARTMVYTYDTELEQFLTKFGYTATEIEKGITAKECFAYLRKNYKVDAALSDAEARKIFIIRNEIATNGFTRYNPITVAQDISDTTIAYIEEAQIPGVSVASETQRYYPNGATAAHILGYMGSISESETAHYVDELNYSATDLVGKAGIEYTLEEKLHGTAGVSQIKVNSSGEYVETISETEAEKGKDVYLTIDLDLQKVAEDSLKEAIDGIEAAGSGAAVAIDVETGDVLAMVSYPSYDPNIFAKGISTQAWASVQAENPRDSWSPAPLYNNATSAAIAPGSTFKPITAITALECGLNPDAYIRDRGYIEYGGLRWACSAYNDYGGNHGSETLEWGIGNSCNYYFYCIATGKDWGTGASLGYSEEISVDKILSVARQFGLGSDTGIELPEGTAVLASAEQKMNSYRIGLWNALYDSAHTYFPAEIADDYDKLTEELDTITNWIYDNPSYESIMNMLGDETSVLENQIEAVASIVKFDYFNQAQWTVGDQFNISIGQGDNAYTPLQIANYVATIGNGGVRNQVSVVAGVEDEGTTKKADPVVIELKEDTIAEVIKGMQRVCTSGTLSGVYGNYPVDVAGKTGTAENQGIVQPADEVAYIREHLSQFNSSAGTSVTWSQVETEMNAMMKEDPDRYPTDDDTVDAALIKASNYKVTNTMINSYKDTYEYNSWTIAMAPADNPKIAVAVMIIQGGYSSNAAPVTRDIITKYLDVYGDDTKTTVATDQNGTNVAQ